MNGKSTAPFSTCRVPAFQSVCSPPVQLDTVKLPFPNSTPSLEYLVTTPSALNTI